MKKIAIYTLAFATLAAMPALGKAKQETEKASSNSYFVRANYNVGGTAPIGMPASIRTLHSYELRPNFSLGFDAHHPFNDRWGVMVGLHFENKGMKTDAGVKNYHMTMVKGGESLEGVFTGNVVTKANQSLFSIPVLATCDLGEKVRLKLGPYFSYVASKKFEGYAYDGYLRQGDPTGPKVMLGKNEGQRGEYDFSNDMRNFQMGIDLGADWYFSKRWGMSVGLTWGLTEVFKKDFKTIEQSMYPIYGNIGVSYVIK